MGLGIKTRSQKVHKYWLPHLDCSKSFLKRSIAPAESIAIIGAGRLLDVDSSWLCSNFREVHLVDYDPGCLPIWKSLAYSAQKHCKIVPVLCDVTGVLEAWSGRLKASCSGKKFSPASVSTTLHDLATNSEMFGPTLPACDVVVSLNILSQLPLYWRDRVVRFVVNHGFAEEKLWASCGLELERAMAVLQRNHLTWLESLKSNWISVITDTEFYYYDPNSTPWQVEAAIDPGVFDQLQRGFSETKTENFDCWLWHIAPAGLEEKYGEIHRIEARMFRKLN